MSRCVKYHEMIKRGEALVAAKELDTLLFSDTEYTGAWYNYALALKELGLNNAAIQYFRTYLDLEPEGYHSGRAIENLKELGEKYPDE